MHEFQVVGRLYAEPVCEPSVAASTMKLIAVAVSSGVVAIPYAFSTLGFPVILSVVVTIAVITAVTLRWMMECSLMSGKTSFAGNAKFFLGRSGKTALAANLVLLLVGGSAVLMLIAIDNVVTVFPSFEKACLEAGLFGAAAVLCILIGDRGERHNVLSVISLLCVLYFAVVLCVNLAVSRESPDSSVVETVGDDANRFLDAVGILVSAYLVNFSIYPVTESFPRNSRILKPVDTVIKATVLAITVLYAVIGIIGVMCFNGQLILPNVLRMTWNLNPSVVASASLALAAVNVLKLPLLVSPLRHTVFGKRSSPILTAYRSVILIALIWLATRMFDDIGSLFGFIGVTCGNVTAFWFPAAMYYRMQSIEAEQADLGRRIVALSPESDPVTPTASRVANRRLFKQRAAGTLLVTSSAYIIVGSGLRIYSLLTRDPQNVYTVS